MYKAVIIRSNYEEPAPTYKEIQAYFRKSGKLLYGNDKRKSKNTPFEGTIHSVMHAFNEFEETITGKRNDHSERYTLYIFDDQINEIHFQLKYAQKAQNYFLLDDAIITEMHKLSWNVSHLKRYKERLQNSEGFTKFMIEKDIGNAKLYKSFPKFSKATDAYISQIDITIKEFESRALSLFKSGWNDSP
jgi:hypothetical protein